MIFFFCLLMSAHGFSQNSCGNPPSYNDPNSQNGLLELMDIPCAWNITEGSEDVVVCVVARY